MKKFYEYEQSCSGGWFESPAIKVFIEARDNLIADELAYDEYGIYFDGVDAGMDCACCGDRWCKADTDTVSIGDVLTDLCTYFRKLTTGSVYESWSKEAGCYILIRTADGQEQRLSVEDVLNYLPAEQGE